MIKAIINDETEKHLINNFMCEYHTVLNEEKYYNLGITIVYPDIDVDILPTDIIRIIKDYYDDKINISYMITDSYQNNIKFWIDNNKIILLQSYIFNFTVNITLVDNFFIYTHDSCYIDNRFIKKSYNISDCINTDLIAVINYYVDKKYNTSDYIPCLSKKFPKIITIEKNYYRCTTVTNKDEVIIEYIQIVDETLFEVIISIISALIKSTCEYLKDNSM
jgi:hypothetical protein